MAVGSKVEKKTPKLCPKHSVSSVALLVQVYFIDAVEGQAQVHEVMQ